MVEVGAGTRPRSVGGTKFSCELISDKGFKTKLSPGEPVAKEPTYEAEEETK